MLHYLSQTTTLSVQLRGENSSNRNILSLRHAEKEFSDWNNDVISCE